MHTPSVLIADDTKKQVNDYLAEYSVRRIREAEAIGPSYVRLREAIDRLIQVGGKRLRPAMVLATFRAYEPHESLKSVLPAAAAQELLHLSMLVHDDIIDRDVTRYGIPNVEGSFLSFYEPFIESTEERRHFALSAAILAGDALLADAHQLIRSTDRPAALVRQVEDIMSESVFSVIGGELLDTESGILVDETIYPLDVAQHKTSSYSFVGPLTTGAILAHAPEQDIQLLAQFGTYLGIAYQLQDDLLGVFGDEQKTGKSTVSDIREGKRTFMIQEFERLADSDAQSEFFAIFHREDASDAELSRARTLLDESGAKQATESRIAFYTNECETLLASPSLEEGRRGVFYELIQTCVVRES